MWTPEPRSSLWTPPGPRSSFSLPSEDKGMMEGDMAAVERAGKHFSLAFFGMPSLCLFFPQQAICFLSDTWYPCPVGCFTPLEVCICACMRESIVQIAFMLNNYTDPASYVSLHMSPLGPLTKFRRHAYKGCVGTSDSCDFCWVLSAAGVLWSCIIFCLCRSEFISALCGVVCVECSQTVLFVSAHD